MGINRSGLYYYAVPVDETRLAKEEEIMRRIDYWYTKFPYFGSRKIVVKLHEEGYNDGRKTIQRLIQKMGIYAIYPKINLSKINLSKRNFKESIVPYLLRNYSVNFPNQVWLIDITYIPVSKGHMYFTAIIDWYR